MASIGPYSITPEMFAAVVLNFADAQRVRFLGIPRFGAETPYEIASAVLRHNARQVLNAGQGHFRFMWITDTGKAIRGALEILPREYIFGLLDKVILDATKQGKVFSCYRNSFRLHGFDMPYARADNLPWLMHAIYEYQQFSGDQTLLLRYKTQLQVLLNNWEHQHLSQSGLIATTVTGDWMDTVLRPSSTYNNICALHMFKIAKKLGLESKTDPDEFEVRLLADRLLDGYLIDYAGSTQKSIDGPVAALYLGVFSKKLRSTIAQQLLASGFDDPLPIKSSIQPYDENLIPRLVRPASGYHSSIWLHLGMMYLNGLKSLQIDISTYKSKLDNLIMRHGNILEALDAQGKQYMTVPLATEYGLTMAAGQYIELCQPLSS